MVVAPPATLAGATTRVRAVGAVTVRVAVAVVPSAVAVTTTGVFA